MSFFSWLALLPLLLPLVADEPVSPPCIERIPDFQSKFVKARTVDVWLPAGYPKPGTRYTVVYMQDGQNLFYPKASYGGVAWRVDSTLAALGTSVRPCIVVGIWNTERRFTEYAPAAPYAAMSPAYRAQLEQERPGVPQSDEYLKFLVQELKPYIDQHFQTSLKPTDTFVAGSSMGGLISLYAALEYPKTFGGAACFSTHWPLSLKQNTSNFTTAMVRYLDQKLPRRHKPRLYFDYGSATLDAWYQPHQLRVDSVLRAHGYGPGTWITRSFVGAAHNEAAWKKRVAPAMQFLLGQQ
jgi:enterochelin esterase-like enzyme